MEETIILSDIKYRMTISVNCSDPIVIHNATSYTKKLMRDQEYETSAVNYEVLRYY
jgi:hypothetical protein